MHTHRILCLALLFSMAGCLHVRPGDTVLDVQAANEGEEARIRRELWRADKAVEEVKFRYGLTNIVTEVVVHDMGGLGQTHPALNAAVRVDGAVVAINKSTLLELHPDTDEILLGLFAHEMAHAMHYKHMSTRDLITLGKKYGRYLKRQDEDLLSWVRAYEQLTDMTAIAMGFGEPLAHQKRASAANIAANHPPKVWNFYLTEDEIRRLSADQDALYVAINEALEEVDLPSLRFLAKKPHFDEYGFLTGFRSE